MGKLILAAWLMAVPLFAGAATEVASIASSNKTRVVVTKKALYEKEWKEAYQNKGVVIPIREHHAYSLLGLHIRKSEIVDVGAVYDTSGVHLVHNVESSQKTPTILGWPILDVAKFTALSMLLLLGLTLIIEGCVMFKRKQK